MHVAQIVAVEAAAPDEAVSAAEMLLDGSRNDWWDYYTIGGRWQGYFRSVADDAPEEGNVLSMSTHPDAFAAVLRDVSARQNETYLQHRDSAFGHAVTYVPDADIEVPQWHVAGAACASDEDVAKRLTEANRQSATQVRDLFAATTLDEAQDVLSQFSFGVFALERMVEMAQGQWNPDSKFIDLEEFDTSARRYADRCGRRHGEGRALSPHLVVVDFHY